MDSTLPEFILEASGRFGSRVYLRGKGIVRSRRYVPPRDPQTSRQQASRTRFKQAVEAWMHLTPEQVSAWNIYGASQTRTAQTWASSKTQNGFGAFMTLTLKLLHAQAGAAVPGWPPAAAFAGDSLILTASAGAGHLVWQASGPNTPGVTTELLAQPLKRIGGRPTLEKYRTQTFAVFAAGQLSAAAPAAAGLWACAGRFICVGTGQMSKIIVLPPVLAGA